MGEDSAAMPHRIKWEWVKGHAGHTVQEVADTAARKIAADGRVDAEMLDELALEIGVTAI